MSCADLHRDLQILMDDGESEEVFVDHDPMSERYGRAAGKLDSLVFDSTPIGYRNCGTTGQVQKYELVVFCEPSSQDIAAGIPGEYAAFEINYNDGKAAWARLFAYYDDHPDDYDNGNHAIETIEDAETHMNKFNKYTSC